MAKSIRSKRKRKLRAIKRVRYAKKELERLKKTLGITDDVEMKTLNEVEVAENVNTIVNGNVIEFSLKEKNEERKKTKDPKVDVDLMKIGEAEAFLKEDENMEVIAEKDVKKLGQFPKWMNQKQIRKIARAIRRTKNKSKRVTKKKKMKK